MVNTRCSASDRMIVCTFRRSTSTRPQTRSRHATPDAPECLYHRRRYTGHDHRTCSRGSRGSASLPAGAGKLTTDAYSQENVVSYRWRVALYAELAPLDDEINIGTGVRFTFRIFTLANLVGPKRQWFRNPMER